MKGDHVSCCLKYAMFITNSKKGATLGKLIKKGLKL
jgi:hypothetical protein